MERKRAIDLANEFRKRVLTSWQQTSEPWPLSGLKQFPFEQTIYLSLKVKETPALLFRAIMKHWKELFLIHGDTIAGIGNMISLIVMPTGEAFCSLRIARFPGLISDTEATNRVDKAVELLRLFATNTERLTATIHNESTLVCSDGRSALLSECECCNMMNDTIANNFKMSPN